MLTKERWRCKRNMEARDEMVSEFGCVACQFPPCLASVCAQATSAPLAVMHAYTCNKGGRIRTTHVSHERGRALSPLHPRIIYAHLLAYAVQYTCLPARRKRIPPPPAASPPPPALFILLPDQLKASYGGSRSSRLVNVRTRRRARRGTRMREENGRRLPLLLPFFSCTVRSCFTLMPKKESNNNNQQKQSPPRGHSLFI